MKVEREWWVKWFTSTCQDQDTVVGKPAKTSTYIHNWNLWDKHMTWVTNATFVKEIMKQDSWYGRNHPTIKRITNMDSRYGRSHRDKRVMCTIVNNTYRLAASDLSDKTQGLVLFPDQTKYKFKHVIEWTEVEHARKSPDYQPMM